MICPNCSEDNAPSARFCQSCGVQMGESCIICGFENPAESSYCGGCGARLLEAGMGEKEGERRQLTVLFCDLAGSTELAQSLDPEDYRNLLAAYHRVCSQAAYIHDGFIAQYLGDGVLIYFGYPRAHEDDAQRAIRCGLDIINDVGRLDKEGTGFAVRLGAHTGRVVVGPVGAGDRQSRIAVGDTPNLAARVQTEAPVGGLAITDTTWRVVEGYFTAAPMGERSLKGVAKPIPLWAVTGSSPSRERVEVSSRLTPFFGRNEERRLLLEAWADVQRGRSRFVFLRGEPGMGKSRLAQWLREQIEAESAEVLTMRSTPYNSTNPFFPVIELLQERLGIDPAASENERLKQLEDALEARGLTGPNPIGLLAPLLSVPIETRYPPLDLSPARRKAQSIELLVYLATRLAERGPTAFVLEDLHWADPSTVEVAQGILRSDPDTAFLWLFTARPEFAAEWLSDDAIQILELPRLDRANVEAIVRSVAAGKLLPSAVLRQILQRSDGVPLFVEEMTRSVLDSGLLQERAAAWEIVGEIPADAIPTTMEASLTARIDRLGASRPTAQLAGTIGREFAWSLLREVSHRDNETLKRDLDQLVASGLVWVTDTEAGTYSFKHALVRDAAYNSLLRSVRQDYHSQIAAALLERFPEQAVQRPDLIADHLVSAGREAAAVPYSEAAARQALDRGSVHEAADHFRRAVSCLGKSRQTPEVLERELNLQIELTPLLMTVYGWGSREVEESCERGLALARELNRPDLSYAPMWGLWSVRFLRGQMVPAMAAAESVLQVAQASGDPMIEVTGRHATSYTSLYRGEFQEALREADAGLALFDFDRENTLARTFGLSSSVCLLASRATSLWMTGRPMRAEREWQRMLELARSLHHPPTLAAALAFYLHGGGFRYSYIRAMDRLLEPADELITLSKDEDFFLWYSVGYTYRAIIAEALGERNQALALMDEGLELFEQTDSRLTLVLMNVLCAESFHRLGHSGRALDKLQVAETEMRERDEGLFAPEIWRIRGAILADKQDEVGAEASFREAIHRARQQNAVALELRAALDLYDLMVGQGRAEPSRDALSEPLSRYSEGFDQPEPSRAAAILGTVCG
jgi:class 3 adenylate cyclase/tetratricopeptide (TPR) repeat protein